LNIIAILSISLQRHRAHSNLHSFPTRRSSDLHGDTLLRAQAGDGQGHREAVVPQAVGRPAPDPLAPRDRKARFLPFNGKADAPRSEEHTSELQSRENLVCRLLLEKKKRIRLKM